MVFSDDWKFPNELFGTMASGPAVRYEAIPTGGKFFSGREKYRVLFYNSENETIGSRIGMQLMSKRTGKPYIVASTKL